MKKSSLFFILLAHIAFTANAQKTATWKGGTPGKAQVWNCPSNWLEGRVPNEFSNVIITDVSTSTFNYPVIETGMVEIFSLYCAPSARLTVHKAAHIFIADDPVNKPVYQNGGLAFLGK